MNNPFAKVCSGVAVFASCGFVFAAASVDYDSPSDWIGHAARTSTVLRAENGVLSVRDARFYVFGRDLVPVRPGRHYRLRGAFRDAAARAPAHVSFGLQLFDAAKRPLNGTTSLEIADTFTELTADAKKGDRAIRVKDALYWFNGRVAFGARADGSDFPNRTAGPGVAKAVRTPSGDWEVSLTGVLHADASAGTGVRLQPGGPAYLFCRSSAKKGEWSVQRGTYALEGGEDVTGLWRGTAYVRPVAYYSLGKTSRVDFRGVRIEETSAPPRSALPDAAPAPISEPPDYRAPALNRVTFRTPPVHPPLRLVEGGRLRFAVVAALKEERAFRGPQGLPLLPGKRSVEIAVRALREAFRKACGRVPVLLEPDDPAVARWPYLIVVGRNALTDRLGMKPYDLPTEGFEVRTFDRGVAIAGMDGFRIPGRYDLYDFRTSRLTCNGTVWGVWDFIERVLDQRHYYPREGEVIPPLADAFTVRPVAYTDAPQYHCRGYHLNHGAFRAGQSSRFFGGESPHPFDLIKAFPARTNELFMTDAKGRLQCDPKVYGRNMFDVSNPVFAETLAGAFARYFETKGDWNPLWGRTYVPNSEWCWFGQCDRSGRIENGRTRALIERNVAKNDVQNPSNYPASATMSSVYAAFFDRFGRLMQTAAPGRKVACEVYADYLYPPTKWTKPFPDNIRVMICYGTPPMIVNEGYRKAYRTVYEGWRKLCSGKLVPYIYSAGWSFGAGIQLSLQGWYMGDYLRLYSDVLDDRDAYACLCGWTKEYFYTMNLCARAMWNPSFDKRAVMDEFWTRFYSPAAARPLKAFHDDVIRVWETKTMPGNPDVNISSLAGPRYANLHATYDATWIRASWKLLDEARRAVVPGTVEGARVEKFLKPWTGLFASRLDGAKQRMVTDVRPNRVPPAFTNGVFRWSDLAWNRSDFRGEHAGSACVGFAPRPVRANPYADDWYRHGAELVFSASDAAPDGAPERSRDGLSWRVPQLAARPATFAVDVCAAHHPRAGRDEKRAAPPVRATLYVNGRAVRALTLADGDWRRVSVALPAGTLRAGRNANVFALTNETTLATAALPVSWLAVRAPELRLGDAVSVKGTKR